MVNAAQPEPARLDPQSSRGDGRHEVKALLAEYDLHAIRHWLAMHPAGFQPLYQPRTVNNVYFDTWEFGACQDNLSGISIRTKVRLRWYGELERFERARLEMKLKRNQLGWKDIYDVPIAVELCGGRWRDIRRRIRAELPPSAQQRFDLSAMPTIINSYQRSYHASHDRKVRVTLDTHQRVWDQRFKPWPNVQHPAPLVPTLIVEFKFDPADRKAAESIMATLPMRAGKSSKYVAGVLASIGR